MPLSIRFHDVWVILNFLQKISVDQLTEKPVLVVKDFFFCPSSSKKKEKKKENSGEITRIFRIL